MYNIYEDLFCYSLKIYYKLFSDSMTVTGKTEKKQEVESVVNVIYWCSQAEEQERDDGKEGENC
jgi:hypothetical protein